METTTNKVRFWCKKCNVFTVFNYGKEESKCSICGSISESYDLDIIDPIVIKEQRFRFLEYRDKINKVRFRLNQLDHDLNYLKKHKDDYNEETFNLKLEKNKEEKQNEMNEIPEIIETDCNIIKCEELTRITINARNMDKVIYQAKTKGLNRNDKCRCGSGKKFKHCCLNKY